LSEELLMRDDPRHRPRPLIRSASVYSGQKPLGRIEVDAGGRHHPIDVEGRRLGEFGRLKDAMGAFGERDR
jgi:hypothetical protein